MNRKQKILTHLAGIAIALAFFLGVSALPVCAIEEVQPAKVKIQALVANQMIPDLTPGLHPPTK
ncbi:MAG: hypothetical protein K5739_09360 [Lachnospiraceae bacterium]|nr:hypothetical protein [Lachnospiraceae bacterium]